MVNFQDLIFKLESLGFADVLLPFILIFTVIFAILQKTDIYELRYIIWKYLHKYKCGDGNIGLDIIGCQNETVPVHYCIQRKNQLLQKLFLCKNCGHKLIFC